MTITGTCTASDVVGVVGVNELVCVNQDDSVNQDDVTEHDVTEDDVTDDDAALCRLQAVGIR